VENRAKVKLRWVDSQDVEKSGPRALLKGVSGILVPGGFGDRGIEGKISVVRYARENKIPFFGICLGMQCAVIEYARHMAKLHKANSGEFDPQTPNRVITLMEEHSGAKGMGATMRLGKYPCKLEKSSKAFSAYRKPLIHERHRHRYEFNNTYRDLLVSKGLKLTGLSPDNNLVEIVELPNHPWFVGVQFHPELKSKPLAAHPLFREFVRAAVKYRSHKIAPEPRSSKTKKS
jgi:CTP synthase